MILDMALKQYRIFFNWMVATEPGKRKYSENDPRLQLGFKLFLEGATDKEVEEQIGINRRTFKRYRQRYGITAEKRKKIKDKKNFKHVDEVYS